MKKFMILLAVAGLIFVSCGTKTEQVQETVDTCCVLTPEQQAMFADWDNWANLTAAQQQVLVVDMKAYIDDCKAKCAEKCKESGDSIKEVNPEKEAEWAAVKAKLEIFNTLNLEEQKACLDQYLALQKACKEAAKTEETSNKE